MAVEASPHDVVAMDTMLDNLGVVGRTDMIEASLTIPDSRRETPEVPVRRPLVALGVTGRWTEKLNEAPRIRAVGTRRLSPVLAVQKLTTRQPIKITRTGDSTRTRILETMFRLDLEAEDVPQLEAVTDLRTLKPEQMAGFPPLTLSRRRVRLLTGHRRLGHHQVEVDVPMNRILVHPLLPGLLEVTIILTGLGTSGLGNQHLLLRPPPLLL